MRKFSIWDAVISAVAVTVVCATVIPAVARLQRTPEDARCQSNMRRFAETIQLYSSEWDGRYPTNRLKSNGAMVAQMQLSPQDGATTDNPVRFVYGINWVEALYPYMIGEAKKTGRDWTSFLKCSRASSVKFPPNSTTARVTYVFNYNMLEQPGLVIRDKSRTMILREIDRIADAICRPSNNSTGNQSVYPIGPFLTSFDPLTRQSMNTKLHGSGSYILFADGHVKHFGEEYWPPSNLSPQNNWDYETAQWWNWVNKSPELNKQIAITP